MYMRRKIFKWMLGVLAFTLVSGQAIAADSESDSDWEMGGAIYLWGANLTAITGGGAESAIPFSTLLDNLELAFMGALEARKDKWSIFTDVIYMDVNAKPKQIITGPGDDDLEFQGDIKLKSWIFTPQVRYAVYESEKSRISIVGGLRYLDLAMGAGLSINDNPTIDVGGSNNNWDFVMGAHGDFELNDKWYMPVYVDVGTGDSAKTWQGMAGVGYRFNKFNMFLNYRYLDYKFDRQDPLLSEMTLKGPMLGASFRFF
jgi:opacity protein-like surface antigen